MVTKINESHQIRHAQEKTGVDAKARKSMDKTFKLFEDITKRSEEVIKVSPPENVEFLENLTWIKNKLSEDLKKGAEDGVKEMKSYKSEFSKGEVESWKDGLAEKVNEQAEAFKSVRNDIKELKLKGLKKELEHFRNVSKHETSPSAFTAFLTKIRNNIPGVKDGDELLVSIYDLIGKQDEKKIGELVYSASKVFATSRLAADVRTAINKKGYDAALEMLENLDISKDSPDVKKYTPTIPIIARYETKIDTSTETAHVDLRAWSTNMHVWWTNAQYLTDLEGTRDRISQSLEVLDRDNTLAANISKWRMLNDFWLVHTSVIKNTKERDLLRARNSSIVDNAGMEDMMRRETALYLTGGGMNTSAVDKTTLLFLNEHLKDGNFSGNDEDWRKAKSLIPKKTGKPTTPPPLGAEQKQDAGPPPQQ